MIGKKTSAISKTDTKYTLNAIKDLGFDIALEVAFAKAISILDKNPESDIALRWLSWSSNMLYDARKCATDSDVAQDCYIISNFYRKLAHKTYWYQRAAHKIDFMMDFVQAT